MRLRMFIGCLLLFILFISACNVKEDLCAAHLCEAPAINLKLSFKDINSEDLLFSSHPAYTTNDLKVYSSLFTEKILFRIDSADKNNKYILIPVSNTQTLTLKLGDRSQDVINIETRYKEEGCCGTIEVESLKLNQNTICSNCSFIQPIILIK